MALPTAQSVVVPFPAGVAAVATSPTGIVTGIMLAAGQNLPDAIATVLVAADQATPADYQPIMIRVGASMVPLQFAIGLGQYFAFPPEAQNLPVKLAIQVQNAGAAATVELFGSFT